jgi:glycosyltransferase involved in cell wall biosynthesis
VLDRHASAQFVFAGTWEDASLERELHERVAGASGRIRFLPSVGGEEKRTLLLTSSILLFPPVEPEGHPRVVLEALAAGLPVVTTDRGTISETVVDGESGLVLPTSNPEELAAAILRILDDEGLRGRLARGARTRYLECYTQEKADETLAAWLARVADEAAA